MDKKFVNSTKELNYADLPKSQEERLREMERQFNNEFGTAFYFMVMERDKNSNS